MKRVFLTALASAAWLAVPAAQARTLHYTVTIDVANATQSWTADPMSMDLTGTGQATWHGVWNVTILDNGEAAQTGFSEVGENVYQELTGTATGSYSGHEGDAFSCTYNISKAPSGVRLVGSGLDSGHVYFQQYSYLTSGRFGFVLTKANPYELPPYRASCSGLGPNSVLNQVSRYAFTGIESCPGEPPAVTMQFPASDLGKDEIHFSSSFTGPNGCAGFPAPFGSGTFQGTYNVTLKRSCPIATGPAPQFGLDWFASAEVTADQQAFLTQYIATLRRAIAAVERDQRLHPERKARDRAALEHLQGLLAAAVHDELTGGRSLSYGPLNPDEAKLLERATCGLLGQAKDSLTNYVDAHGTKNQKQAVEFIDTLGTLASVLDGRVAPTSPEAKKLLESNLIALGERLGGANAGKLTGKGLTLYKVLSGSLSEKQLDATLRSQIDDLTKRIAGKNAAELVHQVLILRDVVAGNVDESEQFEVLKESVVGLATRLLGERVLDTPHVRAAMLGFELGRPFGQRIAADLKLIARKVLGRECIQALAKQQGVGPGEVDYGKKTQTFVPAPLEFQGWSCAIHPEGHVEGIAGGVVEAVSPVKRYLAGILTFGGESVFFDPQFAS